MNTPELKEDLIIQQWLDTINIKATTINNYLHGMHVFTEYTKKTPAELLEEADREQDSNIKARNRSVNKYLLGFRNYLQKQELAPLSIKAYINGVKSFYRTFDIEFKPVQQEGLLILQENKKIPTIEDIRDILKVCDPLERAVALVGCSSGLDSATTSNIKIKDFKEGYDRETGITTLQLRRLKTNVDFITFLTPEASDAVIAYLNFRARTEETGTARHNQLLKQKVTDGDNYLFCLRRIPDDYLTDFDEEKRKINRPAFMKLYRDISTKASKNTKKGQYNYIRSHNFRKFFNSRMLNAGCDYFHCEEFMGHALPGTQGHYYTPDVEELKKYYQKFVPYLTINKAVDIIDSPEWKSLKNENQRLKVLAERYFVDGLELINAKSELRKLQMQALPKEERDQAMKQDIIDFVKNMKPENESQTRFKAEMEKILKIEY